MSCDLQFEFELAVARMVLGPDADQLGGLLANSTGWLGASDETHCGKMATLKVNCWLKQYLCLVCCTVYCTSALASKQSHASYCEAVRAVKNLGV